MAMLKLVPLYGNMGKQSSGLEVLDYLESKKSEFTQWETLRYKAFRATGFRHTGVVGNCNFADGAAFSEKRFNMDPSDVTGNNNAGQFYLNANQPKNALRVLKAYDTRLRDMEIKASAREGWFSLAHYYLGEFEEAINVIEGYPFEWIQPLLPNIHLRSLIELKRYELILLTITNTIMLSCHYLTIPCFRNW